MSHVSPLIDASLFDDKEEVERIVKQFPFLSANVEENDIGAGTIYIRSSDVLIVPLCFKSIRGVKLSYPAASVRGTSDVSNDSDKMQFYCQIDLKDQPLHAFIPDAPVNDEEGDGCYSMEWLITMNSRDCKEMFQLWNNQDLLNPDPTLEDELFPAVDDGDAGGPEWFTVDNVDQL
eukprot:GHVH01000168.1.p1 GENE.GHVH01000168.1~~GHVH01000168.1.p1  ORF type:complete len:176 (+),score=34.82 GHVH01000168.1:39-566(+)